MSESQRARWAPLNTIKQDFSFRGPFFSFLMTDISASDFGIDTRLTLDFLWHNPGTHWYAFAITHHLHRRGQMNGTC